MNQQNNSYVTLKGAWEIFINNIWLFAISMSVGVVIALAYITITPPTYKRTASILIKNEKSGSASGSDEMLLKDLGLAQSNTNLTNEILVLQNPLLMEEVVRRLGLNYNYSIHRKGLRWIDLYGSAPFKVELSEPLRESNISMLLSPRDSVSFTIAELIVDGQGVGDEIQGVYGKPIVTPYGAFTVVENMPLEGDAYGNLYSFSKESINGASSAYMRSLSVALRDEMASIVDISFVSGSTQKAEDVINTLISVYNENWIKDRNLATVSTTSFINDRLAIIERELGEVDRDISSYKSENLLPDVGVVTGINLQSSADILKEQVELNNQLSMAVYVVEYLENKGNSDSLLPVNTGIESPNIEQQISTYNELLLKKKNYLLNSSINNPIVKAIALEQKELKGLIMNSIKEYISAIKIRLEQSQMAEVAAQRRISNNPSQELYLLSSGRKQKIKEELYLFLLQKREENELSQAFVSYNTKVLNLARGSNVPIEPKRMEVLLLGLTLGFILPIIYLLLREAFDTQIKSRADLESLNIPYLGSIPYDKGDRIVVKSGDRSILNEAFRVIRTNLDFMAPKGETPVVQIISLHPGSGKTFTTLNLAISMALKSKTKVLIIDGDIRRATLSKCVDNPRVGLSNYLSGKVDDIDAVILKDQLSTSLDIIPVGTIPPNPSELLDSDRFNQLMLDMRSRYDHIFVDSPPVEVVTDAAIIAKQCNTSIMVVRVGLLDKRSLPYLQEIYNSKKYNSMSILLNAVRYGGGKYGYGGREHYGYSYGYGNETAKR